MNTEKKLEALERRIFRIQQSSGTRWPLFIHVHNWLRMHSQFYYWWHTTVAANPIHISLVSVLIFLIILIGTAAMLMALGFAIYNNSNVFKLIAEVFQDIWKTLSS